MIADSDWDFRHVTHYVFLGQGSNEMLDQIEP